LGVEWDKTTVEFRGIGTIADGGDAFTILRDAAALARNPDRIRSNGRPEPVSKVIAYGYSQTGALLRGLYYSHQNSVGGLAFDGALYGTAAGGCREQPGPSHLCSRPVSGGGKVIAFGTETEAERAGFLERGETSDYRYFEVAGTPHLPGSQVPFDALPHQNPIDSIPADTAALPNLIEWIDGTEPPSSNYIELGSAEAI